MSGVRFRRFSPFDAVDLCLQARQHREVGVYRPITTFEEGATLQRGGEAWTAAAEDGRLLCCAGFYETFPGKQANAWAMLADRIGTAHTAITRFARDRIAESPLVRIEAIVRASPREVAWVMLVGLKPVGTLEAYGADSEDHILFARVRR